MVREIIEFGLPSSTNTKKPFFLFGQQFGQQPIIMDTWTLLEKYKPQSVKNINKNNTQTYQVDSSSMWLTGQFEQMRTKT